MTPNAFSCPLPPTPTLPPLRGGREMGERIS